MSESRVIRITIANISVPELVDYLSEQKIDATVFASTGVGSWGIEPGATLETTVPVGEIFRPYSAISRLLLQRGEECAYVTVDGRSPRLVYPGKDTNYWLRTELL